MAAPREYPLIVGILGMLVSGVALEVHQRVDPLEARTCAGFGPSRTGSASKVRYGWGWRYVKAIECDRGLTSVSSADWEHNDQPWLCFAAAGHGALAAIALGRLRRRKRELVAAFGVDEPSSAQGDGSYRQPEPPARRVLPEHEHEAWRRRLVVGFGVWGLALVVAAVAGHGVAPLPMPLTLLGWSALTLPAALAFARWRQGAWWGPWLMGLGAVALGLVRSFAAAAPALLLIVVCALCAWADERRWRREGRWG